MKKFIATIHHLGFYWPAKEEDSYGKTTLEITADEDTTGDILSEMAFDETNNPRKTPVVLAQTGKCYTLSVGDVVEIKEKKEFWLCISAGWMKVSRSETSYLAYRVELADETGDRYEVGHKGPIDLERRRNSGYPLKEE